MELPKDPRFRRLILNIGPRLGLILFITALAAVPLAFAHHGTSEYDMSKSTSLKGTVTAFDWSNPHAQIHLDVKNSKGEVENWQAESNSPLLLARAGWNRNTLKAGQEITLIGHPAKDSGKTIRMVKIILADGQELTPGQ